MGKKGRKQGAYAKRIASGNVHEELYKDAPHTFVIKRGKVSPMVEILMKNMRRVMEPFTASNLKVRKTNVLKDFINVAGPLNVSHLIMFTQSEQAVYMRIIKMPHGPTLTFKVDEYSLHGDVISSLRKPQLDPTQYKHAPLLVVQGLTGEGKHLHLIASLLQGMFPTINVDSVKLSSIKRCVLFHYDKEEDYMEFRHYNIRAVPVGVHKGIRKMLKNKIPDLGRLNDISEFVERADVSESEIEEGSEITLPQKLSGKGLRAQSQSAVRLTELGPRLRLTLVKAEDKACEGRVLYHKFVSKTAEEEKKDRERFDRKERMRKIRKAQQEKNIENKKKEREENKKRSLAGMKKPENPNDSSEDDDEKYYKEQVGQNPTEDLVSKKAGKRKNKSEDEPPSKKQKFKERNIAHENMVKNIKKKKKQDQKRKLAARKRQTKGRKRR